MKTNTGVIIGCWPRPLKIKQSLDNENAVKDHNPLITCQIIRRLHGNGMNMEHIVIHIKDGNTLTIIEDRLNRWREYFNEMFNVNTVIDEQILLRIPKSIQQIQNRRTPVKDGISGKLIKVGVVSSKTVKWNQDKGLDDSSSHKNIYE